MASTSSPRSANAVVLGAQRPRVSHVPAFSESSGDEAIALAARAGLILDEWQQFVLRQALGERADGRWAASTVGLVVGRQNGKGSVLEALELAALFLFGADLVVHTAHRQKIATNHFRRLRKLIKAVPEFNKRVAKVLQGKGCEAIELHDGRRIEFATRQSGNARGLSADLVVFDEAMYLSDDDLSSIIPTMAAEWMAGNPQVWYVGSAVDQMDATQDGVPFARVREAALAGAAGTAYFEWSAPGDDPERVSADVLLSPEARGLANPGLGIRISWEWTEHERTVDMSARGFAVERLSIGDWPDTSGEASRVISREQWANAADDERINIASGLTFAIDANPDRTWAAIAVAGQRADERWKFAVVEHRRGMEWVVGLAAELQREHEASFVVDTRGPAGSLIPELEDAGVRVIKANTEDYGNACGQFFDAVVNGDARYPDPQPELEDALAGARAAPLGDRWKWARRSPTAADISPLVAVTLALWGARNGGGVPTVWNLADFVGERASEQPPAPAPQLGGQTFVPLDQAPAHRGLFRP